eukprot:3675036-Amphidinium_carterae.2
MTGDLEWHCQGWGLNNPNSHQPCSKCLANTSSYPWTECQDHAKWRGTLWTAETWPAANPMAYPIWDQVHQNILGLHFDLMHVKHLGSDCYILGSFLMYLHKHKRMPIAAIQVHMHKTYKDLQGKGVVDPITT